MPDLSKRSERYATAAIAAVVAGSFCYFGLGLRIDSSHASHANAEPIAQAAAPSSAGSPDVPASKAQAAALKAGGAKVAGSSAGSATASAAGSAAGGTRDCASFPDQEAAQVYWNSRRALYAGWDGNHNGVVCEQLKSLAQLAVATKTVIRTVHDVQVITANEPKPPAAEDAPAPAVKPTAPSKAAILATKHMFGLDTATPDEAAAVESSLARTPQVQGYFQGWDSDFRPNNVNAAWSAGSLPFLTWESRQLSSATGDYYPLADIAAGAEDAYIRKYADAIVANGLPLMIRFDQEMNGNWYRWGETNAAAGNPEGSYIAAWRHIHDIFQAAGADNLVIWDWSPNRTDNIGNLPAIDRYYPGDAYVDIAGMTGYYRYGNKTPTFAATYNATLSELRRVAPGKPIMLSEVGATEGGGNKVNFLDSFFAGLNANPDVIGFAWFNYTVTSTVNGVVTTNDWRINSSNTALDAFRTGLYSAQWGLPKGKHTTWGPTSWTPPPASSTTSPAAPPGTTAPATTAPATTAPAATGTATTATGTAAPPPTAATASTAAGTTAAETTGSGATIVSPPTP